MTIPLLGEGFRGVEGHSGFLLRQAWLAFDSALEAALREQGLTPAQYGALSVLAREPGSSGADLARGSNTTPQAMNGLIATLERKGLIERQPHPTHGRILQVNLTDKGRERLEATNPVVRALEKSIEADFSEDDIALLKLWLVTCARRLQTRTSGGSAGIGNRSPDRSVVTDHETP
jgi:DNA-binding MarR family transcriptional regulator